jgi:hypothetical protein
VSTLFEAANLRHAREWAVFKDADIPDDILIPGMLMTTTIVAGCRPDGVRRILSVRSRMVRGQAMSGEATAAGSPATD